MPPMGDSEFCWAHDPANAEAASEARRLGGMRHKREGTVAGAYQFEGLGNVQDIRRLIQIAVLDTLGMENSIQRSRTLAYLAQTALKSLEVGEVQGRPATAPADRSGLDPNRGHGGLATRGQGPASLGT